MLAGSGAGISAVCRSGLLWSDPADPTRQVLAVSKSSYGAKPPSLAFRVKGEPGGPGCVVWVNEPVGISAEDLIDQTRLTVRAAAHALAEAKAFLEDALVDGPVRSTILATAARNESIWGSTLRRAKVVLGVQRYKEPGVRNGPWFCRLPVDAYISRVSWASSNSGDESPGHGEDAQHAQGAHDDGDPEWQSILDAMHGDDT